jgi:DNA-binding response OmpR family regulator
MKNAKVLLIEDNEDASEIISIFLSDNGFSVDTVFTATDGVAYLKNNTYDIVILDINLPDFDGFEVLKSLKNKISLPIIVTSAFADTKSKVLSFKYGASDYMVKPIDLEELEARIWVQLSKSSEIKTQEEKKPFEIQNSTIFFKQKPLNLTSIEYDILTILIKNANNTISRDELTNALSSVSSNRSLDNHIKNIRKKIGDNGNQAKYIKTEYGIGYRLIN